MLASFHLFWVVDGCVGWGSKGRRITSEERGSILFEVQFGLGCQGFEVVVISLCFVCQAQQPRQVLLCYQI